MKKTLYIKTALSLMSIALLSSCLKDSKYAVDFAHTTPLVELPSAANVAGGGGTFQTEAFAIQTAPQTFKIAVNIAQANPLSSPVTIKLGLDTAAITAYNTANGLTEADGDAYTLLPPADYSTNWTVTIPAGQNLGYVTISVNSSLIDPSGLFILPVKITNSAGIKISNYNEVLYNVQAKNQYDGEYTVTGSFTDVLVPTINDSGVYPEDAYLETQGANSDIMFDPNFGFYHAINSGGLTVYGNFAPIFIFDANNNITSVANGYGSNNSQSRDAKLVPTGVNKFTKGTPGTAGSQFQVTYQLTQGGAVKTTFNETWTYVGPRP